MGNIVNDSFKLNILLMKFFALYPLEKSSKTFYYVQGFTYYILFTVPVPVLATVQLIVTKETDMAIICDTAFLCVQIGILIVKLIPFKINFVQVQESIEMLNTKIFNQWLPEQQIYIDDAARISKRNCWFFLSCCVASLFSWAARPLFANHRKFPIDIWLPFNSLQNDNIYYVTYFIIFIGVANAAIGNAAIDTLIAGLTYHAAAQIKILKDTLQYLGKRVEEQVSEESKILGKMNHLEKETRRAFITYEKICECVDHHNAVFIFVQKLETTFSSVVFSQFLASIVVICVSCLQLSMVEPLTFPFFGMVIYIITMLSEIFLYCYYGTVLYEESLSLTESIYMGTWYEFDMKSKKALITLMERAKRPMIVTAGTVLDLSLNTFTMILRRAYSLLAVLKNY